MHSTRDTAPEFAPAKYAPPRSDQDRVRRPRLVERLEKGAAGRLISVRAPAGFGKSSAIYEWLAASGRRFSWINLDAGDQDGRVILSLIEKAIDRVLPDSDAAFRGHEGRTADGIVAGITTRLEAYDQPFVIVLDDFHAVDGSKGAEAAALLVESLPQKSCIVIASRRGLPFPTARLRSQGELLEVEPEELRFSLAESREFLSRAMKLELSDDEATVLEQKTEGWIAALKMAALSLRGRKDVRSFIRAFGGTNRDIFDFLAEEAFASLDARLVRFLIDSSVLATLNAELCDSILGRNDSAALLLELERLCLFLDPLDEERRWFRYHGLFREALLRKLRQERPDQERQLRLAACDWLEARGHKVAAMNQAIEAGDVARAAVLAESNVLASLDRGRVGDLMGSLYALPQEELVRHPWLVTAWAWACAYSGEISAAEEAVAAAREGEAPPEPRLAGNLAVLEAYIAWTKGEGVKAVEGARKALALLPQQDRLAMSHAWNTLGEGLSMTHQWTDSLQAFSNARQAAREAGIPYVRYLSTSGMAHVLLTIGRTDEARALCAQEIGLADQEGSVVPALGNTHIILAQTLLAMNERGAALENARRGLELVLRWGQADSLIMAYLTLSYAQRAAGFWEQARASIEAASPLASDSPLFETAVMEARLSYDLARGDFQSADELMRLGLPCKTVDWVILRARWLIARHRAVEALASLEEARAYCEADGIASRVVECLVIEAVALHSLSRPAEALERAKKALEGAQASTCPRRLLQGGEPFKRLAQKVYDDSRDQFAARVLDAFFTEPTADQNRLAEALSPRECEVLRLLHQGRTVDNVADNLCISPSTVKTHVKIIYAKLGVHCRVDAVKRAVELGVV